MIELIFVRHGETDSNKRRCYVGWTDVELNEHGIAQANEAKEKLSGLKMDGIFSSPLKRAQRTAEIINENHNIDIILSDSLKEQNFGCWDDLTHDEILEKYSEEYKLWKNDWVNHPIRDGESSLQVYERASGFIDGIINGNHDGVFVIVSHLGCIRYMLAHVLKLGVENSWRFTLDNCGIAKVKVNNEKYAYLTLLNG